MRLALSLILLCPIVVYPQEKPDSPKPKIVFYAGEAALAASSSFDMAETSAVIHRGGWESNPVFGSHPSDPRIAGAGAAYFAVQSTAFYFTERNRRPWVRWTGRALLALTIEEHLRLGACDARLPAGNSPQIKHCPLLMPF